MHSVGARVRVGAKVEVQHGGVGAFDEHALAGVNGGVDQRNRLGNQRPQAPAARPPLGASAAAATAAADASAALHTEHGVAREFGVDVDRQAGIPADRGAAR